MCASYDAHVNYLFIIIACNSQKYRGLLSSGNLMIFVDIMNAHRKYIGTRAGFKYARGQKETAISTFDLAG